MDGSSLIRGDSGRYERETFVEKGRCSRRQRGNNVHVLFDTPGRVRLGHRTPDRICDLGALCFDRRGRHRSRATFEALPIEHIRQNLQSPDV